MTGHPLTMTLIYSRRIRPGSYKFTCFDVSGWHETSEYLRIEVSPDIWKELCPHHACVAFENIWSTADMYHSEQWADEFREIYNLSWYNDLDLGVGATKEKI